MKKLIALAFGALFAAATYLPAQEHVVMPNENLVVDGIPPIPASMAETVERYTENRRAIATDWHPTRREMMIGTRFGNTFQAHLVKMPGGARQQLTFSDEPVYGGVFHPKGGNIFYIERI
jgi:hypothetical protein